MLYTSKRLIVSEKFYRGPNLDRAFSFALVIFECILTLPESQAIIQYIDINVKKKEGKHYI